MSITRLTKRLLPRAQTTALGVCRPRAL